MSKKQVQGPSDDEQLASIRRELAECVAEQHRWYREYVLPSVGEARMAMPQSKFAGKGNGTREVGALPIEIADQLDDSTPTNRFERGRSHIEHLSTRIRSLRTQEAKLSRGPVTATRPQVDWVKRLANHIKELHNDA